MILVASPAVHADVIYNFTYTAITGAFPSTIFQLNESTFLAPGTYPISPFTVSEGPASFTFTQLLVSDPFDSYVCFVFGANVNYLSGCGANMSAGLGSVAMLGTEFPGPNPPSAAGNLSGTGWVFDYPNGLGPGEEATGTVTMDITQTPEIGSGLSVGAAIFASLAISKFRKKRLRQPAMERTGQPRIGACV